MLLYKDKKVIFQCSISYSVWEPCTQQTSNLWTNLVNWYEKFPGLHQLLQINPVIHLKHTTKYFWYLLTLHCIFRHHQCWGGNPVASEIHASFYPFHPVHSSTRSCEGLKQRYILFVSHLSQSVRWQAFHKYQWRIITFPCLAILMGDQTCQCLFITFQRNALKATLQIPLWCCTVTS